MRKFLSALSLFLALTGCSSCATATKQTTVQVLPPAETFLHHILVGQDSGGNTVGALCPVSSTHAYTVHHVLDVVVGWKNRAGDVGKITVVEADEESDFAIVKTDAPFPVWNTVAPLPPRAGDRLIAAGSFQGTRTFPLYGSAMAVHELFLVVDSAAFPGMSGACVWNEAGEVVGVVSGSWFPSAPGVWRTVSRVVPLWGKGDISEAR